MQTIANLTTDDLKQIIKESVRETLSEKKLKDIFYEVIEDIALSKAIDEGMRTDTRKLTNLQQELLKLFSVNLDEKQSHCRLIFVGRFR